MTLLTICQDALAEIGDQEEPTSIVGSSNSTSKQLFALAKRMNRVLIKERDWVVLQKRHAFTTVADQQEYDLPTDFDHIINGTAWDVTNSWMLHEATTPQDQEILQSGIVNITTRSWSWIKGNSLGVKKFRLYPTPGDSTTDFLYQYLIDTPIQSSGGAFQTGWEADTDVPLLDEDLYTLGIKYKFLASKGMPYGEALREYEIYLQQAKGNDGGAQTLFIAGGNYDFWPLSANYPTTGYGT